MKAAVRSVPVALVVRIGECAVHEADEKTSSGRSALTIKDSLVTRRQTTELPVSHTHT